MRRGGGGEVFARYLQRSPRETLVSAFVSGALAIFSQLAMAMVPTFFPTIPLIAMLPISGLVFGLSLVSGRLWRRFMGVRASAPAFVMFNILFLWGVYIVVIRKAVPSPLDMFLNAECALLLYGLYKMLSGDPGIVFWDSSLAQEAGNGCRDLVEAVCRDELPPYTRVPRVRYCNVCNVHVRRFDHHCAAFGNCIGQNNHHLFMALVTGFIVAESTYTICSNKYITRFVSTGNFGSENTLSLNMVISTMLFSHLQLLWQILFFVWHIYCICFNITTEEWVILNFPCFGHFLHQLRISFSLSISDFPDKLEEVSRVPAA